MISFVRGVSVAPGGVRAFATTHFHVPLRTVERFDRAVLHVKEQQQELPEVSNQFVPAGHLGVGLTLHDRLLDDVKSILGSHYEHELYSHVLETVSPHSSVDWESPSDADLALQTALYKQRMQEGNFDAAQLVISRLREAVESRFGPQSRESSSLVAARARCLECQGKHDDAAQLFEYAAESLLDAERRLSFRLTSQAAYNHCKNGDFDAASKLMKRVINQNARGRGSELIHSLAQAKLGIIKLLAGSPGEAATILESAMHDLDELKGFVDHRSVFVRKLWSICTLAPKDVEDDQNFIENIKRIKPIN